MKRHEKSETRKIHEINVVQSVGFAKGKQQI